MKSLKNILLSFALLGLLPLAAQTPTPPPPAPTQTEGKSLQVVGISGSGSSTENNKAAPLALGKKLTPGAKVTLQEGATLTLKIDNDNVIVITGPASFAIDTFSVDASGNISAVISLESGSITVDSPKSDGAIVVKTPTSTVTVDKGVANVSSTPEGTRVVTAQGNAQVAVGETKQTVEAGNGIQVSNPAPGEQPKIEPSNPTPQEQKQILDQAQKAQEDVMKSNEPVVPEAEKQSENSEPSNPSNVVSGEQPPPTI